MKAITVTPHESHLNSDGTVFPPVTPDPPLPPGQEDIQVPDILPVRSPGSPDRAPDPADAAHSVPSPESEGPTS